MIASATLAARDSFVLLQLGGQRFALQSGILIELVQSARVHRFPHRSPLVSGVIVRRGKVVPVYDAMRVLFGRDYSGRHFHLVVSRSFDGDDSTSTEMAAIPVDGECELINAELLPTPEDSPAYVAGVLAFGHDFVEVLDFEKLLRADPAIAPHDSHALSAAETRS